VDTLDRQLCYSVICIMYDDVFDNDSDVFNKNITFCYIEGLFRHYSFFSCYHSSDFRPV
jgi:hypothetical protein